MKLPNGERAEASLEKVRNYLLNSEHPANRGKAAGYARFGFFRWRWLKLRDALLAHACTASVVKIMPTPQGVKYALEGMLEGADGRRPWFCSVWEVKGGRPSPQLVTAHLIPPPKEPS